MTDLELLELAAKAAGINPERIAPCQRVDGPYAWTDPWNPLTDDGDALFLAVKLRLDIDHYDDHVIVWEGCVGTGRMPNGADPAAATRRAIVASAALIGKCMP